MTTLSSHVSPYAGPGDRMPADPPGFAVCATCSAEWTPRPSDDPSDECPPCHTARRLLHDLLPDNEDGVIRLIRELEDDRDWYQRRLAGHRCPEVRR